MKQNLLESIRSKFVYNLKSLLYGPFSLLRTFNVCMWHTGRCGSTVIEDLIKKDGRIDWGSEILESFSKNPPQKIIDNGDIKKQIYRKINKRQKLAAFRPFGFEMKLWHYKRLNIEFEDVFEILQKIGFNKNIILERKNYLRVVVSAKVAGATSQSHIKQGQERKFATIKLDVFDDRLHEVIKIHERFYQDLKENLPPGFLYICYEDDIETDPYKGYKKVIEYFGYKPKNISTQLRKTNPGRLSDIIVNYDDVDNYLANTPYHWMLNT
ncbi:MAG: hypothetical protein HGJ94_01940 [Desulfosarcina sp.]|nr:hypothetical protein [Desulfosarcina sp.]